jgi:hypothetical protein
MKQLMELLTGICLLPVLALGQTVYAVPANSHGNQITLTVANESRRENAMNVQVTIGMNPSAISFKNRSGVIKVLPAGREADVSFVFDVTREARVGSLDTIHLMVKDQSGRLAQEKEIVLQYSGPLEYRLEQNFPNPFNPTTTIRYQLPQESKVSLVVYDILGREVRSLADEVKPAGFFEAAFDASALASGVYICRMEAEATAGKQRYVQVTKLVMMK